MSNTALSTNHSWFDFELPPDRIAQHPTANREDSRLLVLHRQTEEIQHHLFSDLPKILLPFDLLVLNNSKVLPARLFGFREKTDGKWEGLFLRSLSDNQWEMMMSTGGKLRPGDVIVIPSPSTNYLNNPIKELKLTLIKKTEKTWLVEPNSKLNAIALLEQFGHVPLPPYIRNGIPNQEDELRYQTIYANPIGSVAAPTAGLHFSEQLFSRLSQNQIATTHLTLHVGHGTFAPITVQDPQQHPIHSEWCQIDQTSVDTIQSHRSKGGRIIAVGTTSARTLETAARDGTLMPFQGQTNLFIYPPYPFCVLDGLITNFHLPKTTLLLLVSALAGTELLEKAYRIAIQEGYRFYSYGDAMLIL